MKDSVVKTMFAIEGRKVVFSAGLWSVGEAGYRK